MAESSLRHTDFGIEVAKQNIPGHRSFVVPGRRNSISSSTLDDITQTGNAILPRPAGTNIEVVSSSANDTNGGTGVNTIDIEYLDVNGDEASASVTMNGTTPVNVGTAVYDIQWIHSTSTGSNVVAAGNIQVRDVATGAIIYEQISAGGNQSLSARYKIPNGKTGYILGWEASASGQEVDFRLRADVDRYHRTLQAGTFNFQGVLLLNDGPSGWIRPTVPLQIASGATVKFSAKSKGAGGDAGCSFEILLVDD